MVLVFAKVVVFTSLPNRDCSCPLLSVCLYVCLSVSLSLSILIAFSGEPGLASTRMSPMSPFWILLELRMVVPTGAVRCAELQSNHHHQQTNTQFF